jgi:hypothetical protein
VWFERQLCRGKGKLVDLEMQAAFASDSLPRL